MDWNYLKSLNISEDASLKDIRTSLEERQLKLFEQMREESDAGQKSRIKDELRLIDDQIRMVKELILSDDLKENMSKTEKEPEQEETLLQRLDELKQSEVQKREQEKQEQAKQEPVEQKPVVQKPVVQKSVEEKPAEQKTVEQVSAVEETAAKDKIRSIIEIIEIAALILGYIYLFGGIHPDIWHENVVLKYVPDAWSGLVLPLKTLYFLAEGNNGPNGPFGAQLLLLSYTCFNIHDAYAGLKPRTLKKFAYNAAHKMKYIFIVGHLIAQYISGNRLLAGFGTYILLFVILLVFGFLFGRVIAVILGVK